MENDNRPNDYAAKFLADMEAKYAALGAAIASVRAALNIGALGALGTSVDAPISGVSATLSVTPLPLPRGAFLGKSITESIRIYLNAVRERKGNKEIATALKEGGAVSTGNFDNRINGTLFQMKNRNEVLRFDDGWGLAEWYPESFRTKVVEKAASVSGAKRKAKKKASTQREKVPGKLGLEKRIIVYLGPHMNRVIPAKDIAEALGVNIGALNLTLGKMTAKGTVLKWEGGYQLPNANIQEMPKAG
jgi:hypothetical protein